MTERWITLRDRWLLLTLAAPLIVFPWGYDTAELPKLTFLRLTAMGLVLTGLFTVSRSAWASAKEAQISEIHPLRLPIMLLLTLMGGAALMSPDPWSSLAALVDLAMLVFFAFTFTGAARNPVFQERVLRWLTWIGVICVIWTLIAFFIRDPFNASGFRNSSVGSPGPFATQEILAGYLAAILPLVIWRGIQGGRDRIPLWEELPFLSIALNGSRNQKGFTLIELLIVIAVIAILAALAIPNLLSSRKAANETAAIAQLKTISSAEETYKIRNMGAGGVYATLAELDSTKLVQWPAAAVGGVYTKSGYNFSDLLAVPTTTSWGVKALPVAGAGDRDFAVTADNFVRQQSPAAGIADIAAAQALSPVQ